MDGQADLEKYLPDVAEVVIFWGFDNEGKHRNSGVEFGGDVRCGCHRFGDWWLIVRLLGRTTNRGSTSANRKKNNHVC